jgi:hypothetical protein
MLDQRLASVLPNLGWEEKLDRRGTPAALLFTAAALGFGTFAFSSDTGLFVKSPLLHLLKYPLFGKLAL